MARARRAVKSSPKKQPRQKRSRATVDALLQATSRVLVKEGYDRASTNRIAEVAGVNIGSLYQYFPSKEALVAALIDQHLSTLQQMAAEKMARAPEMSVGEAARAGIHAYLDLYAADPPVFKALLEQVPRVERINPTVSARRVTIEGTRQLLEARKEELAVEDSQMAAFILVHLIDGLTQAALLERPEYLTDPRYRETLARIVLRFVGAER